MSRELRPHQTRIIERLRQSLASGRRRPMVQAPTGAGKTVVAGAIVNPASPTGMILSPLSPISPSNGGSDYSSFDSCSASSSYSDGGSSCAGGDGGGGGGD